MRKSIVLGGVLTVIATASLAQDKTYDFTDFNTIEADAGVEVNVTLGAAYSVMATAKRGDLADLNVSMAGKSLSISREATSRGWSLFGFGQSNDVFVVSVTMPDLIALDTASGAVIEVSGQTQTLETLDASSGSVIKVEDAAIDMIRIDATSGSDINISGTCEELAIDTSSGAAVNANGLQCDVVDVSASSGAAVRAFGLETINADASSGASVRLSGDAATIETATSSGASISRN